MTEVSDEKMFRIVRWVAQWTVPPGIQVLIRSYLKPSARLNRAKMAILEKNRTLHNRHLGERCFIIGNGPSLKAQDLSPLANEITFVMNSFWKHPIVEQWQPTYYWLLDTVFFDGSELRRKFFIDLNTQIHTTTFFAPLFEAKIIQEQGLLPLERIHYIASHGVLWNSRMKDIDFTTFVPIGPSTAQFCIMAAMYMGCSPIYLLGLDHDQLSHRGIDRHFYEDTTVEHNPQSGWNLGLHTYKSRVQTMLYMLDGYEVLLSLSIQKGIDIINATNGGFLDVFKRVNYEEVVRK